MYLARRLEEHEREIEELERRLEEYRGLVSEKQIRIEESYLRLLKRLRLVAVERGPLGPRARKPLLRGYIEDWDFSSAYWQLDTGDYISPPSSLKLIRNVHVLCKATGTLNITDGRIVTYMRCEKNWRNYVDVDIHFRNDSPVGSVTRNNAYAAELDVYYRHIELWRWVDGSSIQLLANDVYSDIISAVSLTSWHQYRITWWTDPGGAGLIVRWEVLLDDTWQKMCDDLNDPRNYFSTPNTRRCGVGNPSSYGVWFDDTEIWSA